MLKIDRIPGRGGIGWNWQLRLFGRKLTIVLIFYQERLDEFGDEIL